MNRPLVSRHQLAWRDTEGIGQLANGTEFGGLPVVLNPRHGIARHPRLYGQLFLGHQRANPQHAKPRKRGATSRHQEYSHCTSIVHPLSHGKAIALQDIHKCSIIVLRMHEHCEMGMVADGVD